MGSSPSVPLKRGTFLRSITHDDDAKTRGSAESHGRRTHPLGGLRSPPRARRATRRSCRPIGARSHWIENRRHLIEIEKRRLHLKCAFASLYDYAKECLGYSSGAAHRRIASARALQKYACVHEALKTGRLDCFSELLRVEAIPRNKRLTTASTLAGVLKDLPDAQVDELVQNASGKSQEEVQVLVAAFRPQPRVRLGLPYSAYLYDVVPIAVSRPRLPNDSPAPSASMETLRSKGETLPEMPAAVEASVSTRPRPEPEPPAEAVVEVVHRVQFSMTSATREKFETARDLLGGRFPAGRVRSEPLACARWRSSRSWRPFSMSGSIDTTRTGDTSGGRSDERFGRQRIRRLTHRSSESRES